MRLDVLSTFNRMKALAGSAAEVAAALQEAGSDLVEVSEDGALVRRNPTKPHADEAAILKRSLCGNLFFWTGRKGRGW